ncbi:lysophospholipid acyltransferase family protein [Terrihabitans rhizophilus]|jgi:1-acyl-sn-glycerol-3-phosphate acyltransferase|uniref:Lysophospholipid acyltransferase family protein n=1 Tax=Terrihabitans rhizophilus TaxID=3092662 RepID=A0ABU4RNE7_9HYPH|nr:lysophospholipid acyltransferase family protein [Terrihabitans sp. PJ23]MDX6805738.1 lysophospholipid acyltransferase family protein [Terrihabitans sp. PJ23]
MPGAPNSAEDVLRRRSPRMVALFTRIFRHSLLRDFHAMRFSKSGSLPASGTPHLVLYSNHPSWWDPVAFLLLGDRLFHGRPGFAPIDERMLKSYGFFERIGVFGVDIESRAGAVRFRDIASAVLADPARILLVTAQGRFADVRERPLVLKPGIAHVADWCEDAVFVPLALDYVFWDERKPELLVRFGEATTAAELRARSSRERLALLEQALEESMDRLAAEAISRNADLFTPLEAGRTGVGGVYDLWRRARAGLSGERFTGTHGPEPR